MPPSSRFYDLVHRQLSRAATPEELRELQALLDADPSLAVRRAALEKIWLAGPNSARARGFDVEGAWGKLKAQLPSAAPARATASPVSRSAFRRHLARYVWLSAAAAASIVAGAIAWQFDLIPTPGANAELPAHEIAWDTYESGQHPLTVVVLGDGSRVHLSKQSKLRYPKVALPDRREVFLEGEAYFEVATNPHRPFSVHAPGLVTTVLGTSFNIRAFPDETTRAVSLLTGSIDVTRTSATTTPVTSPAPSRLTPGQQLRFNENIPGHEIRPIEAAQAIGWMRDRLEFRDEPLESIARALTRKFDVDVVFLSPELRRIPVTADYQGQDLATILELLRLTTGAQCDFQPKQGNQPAAVTFRARPPRP